MITGFGKRKEKRLETGTDREPKAAHDAHHILDDVAAIVGLQAGGLMMIRSVVLFTHVVGVLVLFIGIAIEWLSLESLRGSTTTEHASSWAKLYGYCTGCTASHSR